MMSIKDEQVEAVIVANALLDVPYADPDDDLRMLSRQLLRRHEELSRLSQELAAKSERCATVEREWDESSNALLGYRLQAERLSHVNGKLVAALSGARTNVAYAYQEENCGDHCRNNCRDCVLRYTLEDIDAALADAQKENK